MSTFENKKKTCLAKIDRSQKGSIDKDISKLVNIINSKKEYFTASSCSGRSLLITKPESDQKNHSRWLFVSHDAVKFNDVKKTILTNRIILPKDEIWFKKEGAILHVCCRTIEDASILLNAAKLSGFKRSGITTAVRRIITEIIDTENMDLPIAKDKELLVSEEYLKLLVEIGNKKRLRTLEKIKKFERIIKKINQLENNK